MRCRTPFRYLCLVLLLMLRWLAVESSGRNYLFLTFYFPLSLLDPYNDYVEVNISSKSPLSTTRLRYALADSRSTPFLPPFYSSWNFFILGYFNCHHPFWVSRRIRLGYFLGSFNDSDTLFLHCSSGSRFSLSIFFATCFHASERCFRTLFRPFTYLTPSPPYKKFMTPTKQLW